MRKLVLATDNKNKVNEIKDILSDLPIEILSKDEIGLEDLKVIEDGETLIDNSLKKAREISKYTDYLVVADDTGLFVEKLNGEPGVYSSRYAGEDGNDKKNVELLLKKLNGEESNAYFETVICLITEDKKEFIASGRCFGKVLTTVRGENGFGYDPIFQPDGFDKTFAELGSKQKNEISHRRKAIENLREILIKLLGDENENTCGKWYP